ncbi:MAG: alpha/beta fold hydrolase [Bacteroidetes bacterium]|nr:alpha/beta fold hydrolase [Bacteroidota bacterium]
MKYLFTLIGLVALLGSTLAQEIARKALIGTTGKFYNGKMVADTVVPKSTMQLLGLQKGDTLQYINGEKITDVASFNKATGNIRTGDKTTIIYINKGKYRTRTAKAVMRPYETSETIDVLYDWVQYKQCKLRTITRRPKDKGDLPAILLIPGYNCGSVENFSNGIYKHLLETWLDAGYAVVTIEKTGLGDSYGCVPCSEADLVTDIEVFNAGYQYMEALPFVNKNNLFIWGHSMGGVIAPEIAKLHKPKGVIVFATVFRPWSEFLLEMHRVQYPLDGKSYTQTEADVRGMQKIYYEFFRLKKSPAELYENPEYRKLVEIELEYKPGKNDMWGRHWRYWQQIDSLDLAASWSAVECPVLSLFGGADYIACSLLEHQLIERTVNATHPGNCTHITIPDIDHLIVQQPDWKTAHKNFNDVKYRSEHFHYGLAKTTVEWMDKIRSK